MGDYDKSKTMLSMVKNSTYNSRSRWESVVRNLT